MKFEDEEAAVVAEVPADAEKKTPADTADDAPVFEDAEKEAAAKTEAVEGEEPKVKEVEGENGGENSSTT